MKKFAVAIAIMSISVLASCGGGTPEEVAIQFNEALLDGDVEAAQDLSTEETAKLMPLIIGFASSQTKNMSDEDKKKRLEAMETMECDAEGEKAMCGPKGQRKTVELQKVDGDWKVHINKKGQG